MKSINYFLILLISLLISCDSGDDENALPEAVNITAELISFKHVVDKEEKTESLEYKISVNNLSSFDVKGLPRVAIRRMNDPETSFIMLYLNDDIPCEILEANSTCVVSHINKETYSTDVTGPDGPAEIQFVNFEYLVVEEFR